MRKIKLLFFILNSFLLTSCMVGPNYQKPGAPQLSGYTHSSLSDQFVSDQDIPAQWWEIFHSESINSLVTAGLNNSPTLTAATATLKQAQENLRAQIGSSLLPNFNGQLNATRQQTVSTFTGQESVSLYNLYNASANVSYVLDIFGGARRGIEALSAQVDYQQYQLEGARLTLASNIVTTAINIASQQQQIQATQEIILSQQKQLNIVNQQFKLGGASEADILAQQSQLAATQATLPPLKQKLAQYQDLLAVLIGSFPSEFRAPEIDLNKLIMPQKIPVSLPSKLTSQRPDIRAQEALLHAASAQIGVATANLLPQITLSGAYGPSSISTSNLFSPANIGWNYGAGLTQPLFHGGALLAQRRGAVDAYDQAMAQYQETVLQAFQNVADVLQALQNDKTALRSQKLATQSAYESLKITESQYQLGGVSYLNLLTAQRQYQTAKINLIQAKAAQLADVAALFQALGGGWWHR